MASYSRSMLVRLLLPSMLGAGLASVWPAVAAAAQNQETPEVKSEETAPTFTVRAQRNEVLVRVIVRDKNGNVVSGLTKDDFRLFDNGKPQSLTAFTVEKNQPAPTVKPPAPAAAIAKPAEPAEAEPVLALPERYVAFYFDDLVVSFEDMVRMRDAAGKFIESSLQATDRAGIFTSSGLGVLDFTADRAKLREALVNLRSRPRTLPAEYDCPPLTPYEAYLIDQQHDSLMLDIAAREYIVCACGDDAAHCPDPQAGAQTAARLAWLNDQVQSRQSLRALLDLVRRLGALPGQRSVLWLSQGFLALDLHSDLNELTDRALREHVVINALDSRGLWVDIPGGEASEHNIGASDPSLSARQSMYRGTGKSMNQDVMAQVSHDTGGVFIRNTNDYDGGFRKAGALPEFSYLLAFSPQNLKYDGKYHKLKVELVNGRGLSLQARNGYFARNEALHPEERARLEIEDVVFSREEYREFPVDLHTQFFKLSPTEAQLSVMARVDAHSMHFRKEGERNLASLKMVCAAFDRDGNLATGIQRSVELKLRDATLTHLLSAGLNIRGQLKLSAGTYLIRVVVYQNESAQVTAMNRTVEIPF